MSAISLKSITGITSITTPAGVDNVFTVHTNDTTERFRVDQTGNLNIAGIVTVTKDIDVDGHTNLDNVSIAGVATLTSGSNQILFNTDNGNIEITRASGGPFIDFKNSTSEDFDVRIQSSGSGGRNVQMRSSAGTGAWLGYANNSYDLGSSSVNWRHLYVNNVNIAGVTTFTGAIDANSTLEVAGIANFDSTLQVAEKIEHLGDTDTYLQFTANTINLHSGGTTGLTVLDTSVRVPTKLGINGAAPQTPIDVIANGSGYAINVRGRSSDNVGEIRFTSNNYGSLYSVLQTGATYLNFQVGSVTNALRIDSNGRLGIGEVSPDNTLHITKDGQNHGIKLERTGTNAGSATINCNSFGALALTAGNNLSLYSGGSQQIMFYRGASTEIARFDTSGRFLLGTTTAGESNSAADDFVIGNSGSGNSGMSIITGTGNNGHILFGDGDNNTMGGIRYQHSVDNLQLYAGGLTPFHLKSNALGIHENYPIANSITIRGAATDDTPLLVLKRHTDGIQNDGEIIGKIQFMSNEDNVDSGNHQPRAEIHGVTVNTAGAAKLDFYTVPNSTTTPIKRMTLNQLGQLTVPNQPSFMANFGATNNTSHNNGDYLKFSNTDHNTGNCYNTSNYRFTAPIAGNYLFYGRANMSGATTNDYSRSFQVRLYKNGVSEQFHMSRTTLTGYSGSYPDTSTMVCSINLASNDYVQLRVNWETDGTMSGTENFHHHGSLFGGYLIG